MKRLMLAAGLAAAFALLGGDASAQTGTARGKVVDEKGQAIPEVTILIEFEGGMTRKFETKTNKKGEFTQVGIAPGAYKITASKEGYQGSFVQARISLGDPTYLPDIKILSKEAATKAAASAPAVQELQAQFGKATELTQAGKFDEAEAAYKALLATHPDIPEIHLNLGYVYARKKDWPSAEAAYKKALELRPNYAEALSGLASVYGESGQREKGVELLSQAATSSSDPKVHFNLGVHHFNAGKYDEASAAFGKVMELDPNNADVHFHLGSIALNQGKTDVALKEFEKFLSMNPANQQYVQTAQGLLQALKPKK